MDAFDRLPPVVRRELSFALLNYTAIDFYINWRRGMSPAILIDVLHKANRRDHDKLAKHGKVVRMPIGASFDVVPIRRRSR